MKATKFNLTQPVSFQIEKKKVHQQAGLEVKMEFEGVKHGQ